MNGFVVNVLKEGRLLRQEAMLMLRIGCFLSREDKVRRE